MTVVTRLLDEGETQVVLLPTDVAFPDDVSEVEVVVVGSARLIRPKPAPDAGAFELRLRVPDDFMVERDQPPMQVREWLD